MLSLFTWETDGFLLAVRMHEAQHGVVKIYFVRSWFNPRVDTICLVLAMASDKKCKLNLCQFENAPYIPKL